MTGPTLTAKPYPFPFQGAFRVERTGLLLLGFQGATVEETGAAGKAALAAAHALAGRWMEVGGRVFAGRRGVARVDAMPPAVRFRNGRRTKDRILVAGTPGWDLVLDPDLARQTHVFDHPSDNAFIGSELDHLLRRADVGELLICGLRTEGCVHSTMREANDRGFECSLVADASASDECRFHDAILSVTAFGNGLFGTVTHTADVNTLLKEPQ